MDTTITFNITIIFDNAMKHTKKSIVYDNKGWVRSFVITSCVLIILLSLICFHLLMLLFLLYLFFLSFFALFLTIAMFKYHARRNYYILNSPKFCTGNEIGNPYPKSLKIIPRNLRQVMGRRPCNLYL